MGIPHFRGIIVDAQGRPTRLFYDYIREIEDEIEEGWVQVSVPAIDPSSVDVFKDAAMPVPFAEQVVSDAQGFKSIAMPVAFSEQVIAETEQYMVPVVAPAKSYFQSISTSTTTSGDQTLICTAAITVTLNDNPADGERVAVKRTNGQVVINGNGRNIDGASTFTLLVDYDSVTCVYSAADDAWFVI